jgi:hypothetical protein
MTEEAYSGLSGFKGLNTLDLQFQADPAVLTAVGRKLVSLEFWRPSKEVVDGIVESCPSLQYLELDAVEFDDDEEKELLVGLIKNGLKKLAKFKLNKESIRLGTDREGY